jgi:NAD(P)H dehydrogenase (quinone)
MILITGATGHLGTATIDFLLGKGILASQIGALVRDESKATLLKEKGLKVIKGDYGDYPSLVNAFKGVEKLFFISSNDHLHRVAHHKNIVNAAKEAGVDHIVYTSLTRKTENGSSPIAMIAIPTIETEQLIRDSGISFTLLKNALYADVLPAFLGLDVLNNGIYFPAGNGKASFTSRHDLAEASANVLTTNGHKGNSYVLTNTVNYSFHDIAAILSRLSNKNISYISPTAEQYSQALTQMGVPEAYLSYFNSFAAAIKAGEFKTPTTDLPVLLKRVPTTLETFLQQVY